MAVVIFLLFTSRKKDIFRHDDLQSAVNVSNDVMARFDETPEHYYDYCEEEAQEAA